MGDLESAALLAPHIEVRLPETRAQLANNSWVALCQYHAFLALGHQFLTN